MWMIKTFFFAVILSVVNYSSSVSSLSIPGLPKCSPRSFSLLAPCQATCVKPKPNICIKAPGCYCQVGIWDPVKKGCVQADACDTKNQKLKKSSSGEASASGSGSTSAKGSSDSRIHAQASVSVGGKGGLSGAVSGILKAPISISKTVGKDVASGADDIGSGVSDAVNKLKSGVTGAVSKLKGGIKGATSGGKVDVSVSASGGGGGGFLKGIFELPLKVIGLPIKATKKVGGKVSSALTGGGSASAIGSASGSTEEMSNESTLDGYLSVNGKEGFSGLIKMILSLPKESIKLPLKMVKSGISTEKTMVIDMEAVMKTSVGYISNISAKSAAQIVTSIKALLSNIGSAGVSLGVIQAQTVEGVVEEMKVMASRGVDVAMEAETKISNGVTGILGKAVSALKIGTIKTKIEGLPVIRTGVKLQQKVENKINMKYQGQIEQLKGYLKMQYQNHASFFDPISNRVTSTIMIMINTADALVDGRLDECPGMDGPDQSPVGSLQRRLHIAVEKIELATLTALGFKEMAAKLKAKIQEEESEPVPTKDSASTDPAASMTTMPPSMIITPSPSSLTTAPLAMTTMLPPPSISTAPLAMTTGPPPPPSMTTAPPVLTTTPMPPSMTTALPALTTTPPPPSMTTVPAPMTTTPPPPSMATMPPEMTTTPPPSMTTAPPALTTMLPSPSMSTAPPAMTTAPPPPPSMTTVPPAMTTMLPPPSMSTEPPAMTTTPPPAPSMTTVPPAMTTTPPPPSMTTAPPVLTTTPMPPSMTTASPALTTTPPPSSMTTVPAPMTTTQPPPSMITMPPEMTTTPPPSMTTAPLALTTTPPPPSITTMPPASTTIPARRRKRNTFD